MHFARPAFAPHPASFGRARARALAAPIAQARRSSDDLKLFATTFAAGFLFVSIVIA